MKEREKTEENYNQDEVNWKLVNGPEKVLLLVVKREKEDEERKKVLKKINIEQKESKRERKKKKRKGIVKVSEIVTL